MTTYYYREVQPGFSQTSKPKIRIKAVSLRLAKSIVAYQGGWGGTVHIYDCDGHEIARRHQGQSWVNFVSTSC